MKALIPILISLLVVGCGDGSKVVPNDPNVEAAIETAIREVIKKPEGELTNEDFGNIKWLEVNNLGISDVTILGKLTQLQSELDLRNNRINNISPLSNLTKLEVLWLYGNNIEDISPLSELKKLTRLYLGGNEIRDVYALKGLHELTLLGLGDNNIKDVSSLTELKQLENLALSSNKISDIKPLAKLKKLKELDLRANPDLTKAQITELQKALPKCKITHNAK
jgi:Leucine-rich repeat (LRR) protein